MVGRKGRTAVLAALAALAVAGCGGGERQDADEREGEYRVEVTGAKFPTSQSIAQRSTLAIEVRNAGQEAAPNVAVTVETAPRGKEVAAPLAFGEKATGSDLADAGRPIWIIDREPEGGTTAYTNTWALGRLEPGRTARFEWQLTAVKGGDYTVAYRVAPGLDNKARLAGGARARGEFQVRIGEEPRDARVTDDGEIIVE